MLWNSFMGNRFARRTQQQRSALCPSKTKFSDFLIVRTIGRGTFGKVHIVFHLGMKKYYALKTISKRRMAKTAAENVLRELELLQQLSHPFLINLWFTFQDDYAFYMVSDLLLGGDLRFHLKQHGRFSESRSKLLICEIALALDYLHKQRIVHRDVKPENILLDDDGHAHLTDFNLAIKLEPNGLATDYSGTRFYMAPEILLTSLDKIAGYDMRVDWWSLGVCFYETLRGRPPFHYPPSFSSLQILGLIYTNSVVMPSQWPSDLISFLNGVLNPDSERRIDTFDKLRRHPYMQRMDFRAIFDRKVTPIFVPKNNTLNCDSPVLRARTTASSPHHRRDHNKRHHRWNTILHRRHSAQQQNQLAPSDAGSSSTRAAGECNIENEHVLRIAETFKEYNRFKCEMMPAEARQSLDIDSLPMKESNSVFVLASQQQQRKTVPSVVEKMRNAYRSNNREVNYSM